MSLCCATYYHLMIQTWKKNYKQMILVKDRQLALILSIAALSNAFVRLLVGLVMIKASFKMVFILKSVLVIGAAFSFEYVMKTYGNLVIGCVYLSLALAGIGMHVTVFPTLTMKVFGTWTGTKIYPLVWICYATAHMVAHLLYRFIHETRPLFFVAGSIGVVGLLISLIFNESPSWKRIRPPSDRELEASTL